MGLFDIFQKKDKDTLAERRLSTMHTNVSEAFSSLYNQVSSLNENIEKQKQWLKYLHENHLTLHNKHEDHKDITKKEVTRINSWITFLHKSVQNQEKQLTIMQKTIQDALNQHDAHLSQLYEHVENTNKSLAKSPIVQKEIVQKELDYDVLTQAVMQNLTLDLQAVKADIKKEVYNTLYESLNEKLYEKTVESNQKSVNEIREIMDSLKAEYQKKVEEYKPQVQPQHVQMVEENAPLVEQWASQLTNPEQKLLNLMISESDPLTYTKISQLTGHSINTVRVNMNILKKKGFVEESTLPSGVKLFSVTNKEKVKKMYNVQVL